MKNLILVISTLLLMNTSTAFAFDEGRINFRERVNKLNKINRALARKVQNVNKYCFQSGSFKKSLNTENIKQNPNVFSIQKLNIFDMEKGVSHRRGLDNRRKKEENHPGRITMDIVTDMLKDEIKHTDIKTYEALLKIACSSKYLLTKYKFVSNVATTVEHKIERDTGSCWDSAHIAIRMSKALGIPLKRLSKGTHIFVGYEISLFEKYKSYFAIDPFLCEGPHDCANEIYIAGLGTYGMIKNKKGFSSRTMKSEKCYINTMKNDPNKYLYFN